ncbi:MAG: M55 family metallopeptidase [Firmicutes bacterium]|nr:M55 family metallopeptidase [Bacillota bacterium]
MKVYISADLEGISGITHWDETGKEGGEDYQRARRLMTREVNAAVEGAVEAGATEVVVNDSHGHMRNLLIEELHPAARLISGSPKPFSMVQGLDGSFACAFFIGYHARAGSRGVLSHTYTGTVAEYRVNGRVVGETGMNAAVAGEYGVPVVLVSGDSTVVEEARGLLGPVETVAVKEYVARNAAVSLPPEKVHALLREAARRAVARAAQIPPFRVEPPVEIQIRFTHSGLADAAELMPGALRIDDVTVGYRAPDFLTAYRAGRALMALAAR